MQKTIWLPIFTLLQLTSISLYAIDINQQGFNPDAGFTLATSEEEFRLGWKVNESEAFIEFQFIPRQGNTPAAPLIKTLGFDNTTIMEGLDPNYLFWVGDRDLELRGG